MRRKLVIDTGAYQTKVGFAGTNKPLCIFPTVLGHQRADTRRPHETFYGKDAQANRAICQLFYPNNGCSISNWSQMEEIWEHMYRKLMKVKPEQHAVMHVDGTAFLRDNRVTRAEIFFEKFKCPAQCIAKENMLCMCSTPHKTGILMESGASFTSIAAYCKGKLVPASAYFCNNGGNLITDYLVQLMTDRGYAAYFQSSTDMEIARTIKETLAYVPLECKRNELHFEIESGRTIIYYMPDKRQVILGDQLGWCTEVLFKPQFIACSRPGIHEAIYHAVMACKKKYHKKLYGNIVLAGGNVLFDGLIPRLQKDLRDLMKTKHKPKINIIKNPITSAWLGGSKLADSEKIQKHWITKQQYDEHGANILHCNVLASF